MRQLLTLVVLLFMGQITYAQTLSDILKNTKKGERTDTLVAFNGNREFENIPLAVIKGIHAGPVFTIIAGIHGYEYPPIIAVQELMKEIDTDKLSGTLVILPITNVASFYHRTPFSNPIDRKNLNNVFPGSATGTITEKIAYWITKEIIPVTNILVDIHAGDASEDLLPFICYYESVDNSKQTDSAKKLSDASGMEYIVSYPYTLTKTEAAKYAFKQAVQDGIVALSIEAGKLGTVQDGNVKIIKDAVYNILGYMEMYDHPNTSISKKRKYLTEQTYIKVPLRGIFYSTIKSGDEIKKDEELGYITDEFGKVLTRIIAPNAGIILYKVGTPPVNIGETLFCIGH